MAICHRESHRIHDFYEPHGRKWLLWPVGVFTGSVMKVGGFSNFRSYTWAYNDLTGSRIAPAPATLAFALEIDGR
ncbi:uncharacterized protein G2W53_009684 [Senna tora]|uniref:Uncharacterized protein n=1 Tax=Senna tora TaxID=362788 RepID=A0A835CAB7_9FABA|nr:uncharacterized protein G2W53_009684 [Senna tora]